MQKTIIKTSRSICFVLIVFLLCSLQKVSGQERSISGLVTDTDGTPLIGVSVSVKGSSQGVTTNLEGKFIIKISNNDKILEFSYLGYDKREIATIEPVVNVSLNKSSSLLDDVVVIGYGSAQRKDLTGSVGSIDIEALQKAPVKSFDEALGGRVAGVQVVSSEGQPGSSIDIVIRGNNSVSQSNYPLFVIDGFPLDDADQSVTSPINSIDPNDIESIDVLKDASATAIFGARGSNGVVMITTKRGKIGAPRVTYNGYYGLQENKKRLDVLSPYEFVKLQNELDPKRTEGLYFPDDVSLEDYRGLKGINWEDQISRIAPMQNHYVSLTGGTVKTKYSASMSYTEQDGILINSGFNRTQGRFSLDQEVNDKLKVGMNSTYAYTKNYGTPPSTGTYSNEINLMFSVWAFRPLSVSSEINLIDLAQDPEVEQGANFTFNPILTTKHELRENYGNSFVTNGYLEYSFLKELKLRLSGGYTASARDFDVFNDSQSRSGRTGNQGVNGGKTVRKSGSWQTSNTLTYAKRFNPNHYINAVGGFAAQGGSGSSFGAYSTLLPNESLGISGLDEGTPLFVSSRTSNWTMASFFTRVNYKLYKGVLLTGTLRADGSSKFLGDNKWGIFPSGAVAWQMTEEKFMKQFDFVSNSKLRVSWGRTGNNRVSDFAAYPRLDIINPVGVYYVNSNPGYMFNNSDNKGIMYSSLGNYDLKWETTEQLDIGLDLGFMKERIALTVDLYRKQTYDLLLDADLSPSTGYFRGIKNIGKVRNEGLELTATVTPFKGKNFNWNSSLNISFNRNSVRALAENQSHILSSQFWGDDWKNIPGYLAKLNQPIAQFYGLIYDGVYTFDDFIKVGDSYTLKENITANGGARANVKPGDKKFKDLNGDLTINDADKVIIGNPYPKHFGGWNNNFGYKDFDLNVFFQWSYGNEIMNANRIVFESAYKYGYNQFASYANRWSPENQESTIPGVAAARGSSLKSYSTRVIEDGSFLRLKTISLGYTLPKKWLNAVKVQSARAYLSAQNLHTWTKYSGYDPEVSVRNSALTPGFDYSAYPRARTITLGISSTF